MPPMIRAILTLTVIVASAALWLIRQRIGLEVSAELLVGLTAFMCVAVWLFPEVKKDGSGKR
ncbi:MAG: hypothetical protein OXH38_03855 [Chloroflexi bacterium]|nr:hypothetical protein [Chloroflexota bacterium]MCY3856518.1 hypothetical protein [Rhodospirillales bacterium]MCY4097103.1 hypothetical protein [Rhodospirillales bacterium]MDE0372610.1 hypothetical protein [Rhodospirillales bacterium]MYE18383.1 hypothetical protein [Rhodospirillales bacterium]